VIFAGYQRYVVCKKVYIKQKISGDWIKMRRRHLCLVSHPLSEKSQEALTKFKNFFTLPNNLAWV